MKMRLSLLAATLVAPFALSACVVEDDSAADTTEAAVADAGSQAAAEADAAADRAEAAADRAASGPDVVIDPPDVVVEDGDRDGNTTETTVRAGEDGLEVSTTERSK